MQRQPLTLIEHITRAQASFPDATGDFTQLMEAIALACKLVAREVNKAGVGQLLGLAGRRNVQGEQVARLDEFANDTLVHTLSRTGVVCALGSEELAVPILLPGSVSEGKYAVLFDPLDGSSNIDLAMPVGTIFGVYRRSSQAGRLGEVSDLLQPARALIAAGYAVYGSSTVFVYTTGEGVHGFTLDPSIGEFLLSHPDIRVPERGSILSINIANRPGWDSATTRAVDRWLGRGGGLTSRYVGSLVADAHRALLRGGLFAYPADTSHPEGKLRLLYEAGPMALLFEKAGGAAGDGRRSILDIQPRDLHDRTPLILAGKADYELWRDALGEDDESR
ncbi:MAG: class 1 fructose-bisphosphatase [Acidobacteriota bacterium]|nr:class 1 fructose-bisphosphatase [Acidobacteriota bacterium]MDQ7086521.1 class 1 fructose-bisphosphatase [Acidobacteriota bacterium]